MNSFGFASVSITQPTSGKNARNQNVLPSFHEGTRRKGFADYAVIHAYEGLALIGLIGWRTQLGWRTEIDFDVVGPI